MKIKLLTLDQNELWIVTCALRNLCTEQGSTEMLREYPDLNIDIDEVANTLDGICEKLKGEQ